MNKKIYIFDKQKAKLNQWQLVDIKDENDEIDDTLYCYWLGNEYPFFSMFYDEKNNIIREKTKYERYIWKEYELQDGEYIENEELKYIKPPEHDRAFWYWKDRKWQFNFIEWKKSLNQRLFNLRDHAFNKDLTYNNFTFRMLPVDVENFKEKALQVSLGFAQLTDVVEWRLKNDEVQQFVLKEILEILSIWGKRKIAIFEKFNNLYIEFMAISDENKLREFMKEVEKEWE